MFATLDLIFIGIYFLIVLFVGFRAGRDETQEGFLIAGRNLKALPAAFTIVASKIGGGMLLTYTAAVYIFGMSGMWFFIGAIVGYVIFYFFAKHIKALADSEKFYTLPDYFFYRFGTTAGRVAGITIFITMFGWVVVNLIGGGKILEQFTPLGYEWSVILIALTILSYLLVGGFKSVVKTDAVQSVAIGILFLLFLYVVTTVDITFAMADFNLFTLPIVQIISFFLVGIFFPFASAELWQRVYAIENQKTLKRSLILASLFYIALGFVLGFIMLAIRSVLPGLEADTALVAGLTKLLPVGLSGLGAVVFYSAIMSSADTFLFTANASLTNDLLLRDKTEQKNKLLLQTKLSMTLLAVMALLLAIVVRDIIDATFLFVSFTVSLGFLVLLLWKFNLSKYSVILAMILNILGILFFTLMFGMSAQVVLLGFLTTLVGIFTGSIVNRVLVRRRVYEAGRPG